MQITLYLNKYSQRDEVISEVLFLIRLADRTT